MKAIKLTALVVFLCFVALWLIYVWPTPWNYYTYGRSHLRVNRFTGQAQMLNAYGWQPQAQPFTARDLANGPWNDYTKRDANGFEILTDAQVGLTNSAAK